MLKTIGILGLIALIVSLVTGGAFAIDSPHTQNCGACHLAHNSLGPSYTTQETNELLCMSCHKIGGAASGLPFSSTDKAVVGTSGTSHAWGVSMDAGVAPLNLAAGNPNNKYGLKTAAEVTDAALQSRLQGAGNKVSCSVCHDQHSQANATWNAYAAPALSGAKGDNGAATSDGATTTINDTAKSWSTNGWVGYYVRLTMGNPANLGHIAQITANTAWQLAVSPAFPAAIAAGDKYEIMGKGYMRTRNDLDQLCVACHAYRVPTSVPTGGVSQTDVRTWDGNVKSHPIAKVFTSTTKAVSDASQFNSAPLEPASAGWAPQTGWRYHMNGGTDTNVYNNLVMGPDGQVRCLTCHRVHYADSNSATPDIP